MVTKTQPLYLAVRDHADGLQYLGVYDSPELARHKCREDWNQLRRSVDPQAEEEGLMWQTSYEALDGDREVWMSDVGAGYYEVLPVTYYWEV